VRCTSQRRQRWLNVIYVRATDAVAAGDYHFNIGTAGAAPLVVQTVLMPLTQAGGTSTVRVTGGTHVPHSPPVEYFEQLYIPALRRARLM
jgi:RNA 3'-terminal phosphate cyclase (ATP)